MRLVSALETGTNPIGQLGGRQQPGRLGDSPLAMQPLGLDRIEPGALAGQVAHQETHAAAGAFDLAVVAARIQSRTIWLTCQGALSQIKAKTLIC